MKIIDAEGAVLGRMASLVAKQLLNGEKIVIVNAEKAVISGSRKTVFATYKQKFDRASLTSPLKGPRWERTPERLVRRTVRGMIAPRTARGAKAYHNLRTYIGVPEEFKGKTLEKIETQTPQTYITVEEVSRLLGWKGGMV